MNGDEGHASGRREHSTGPPRRPRATLAKVAASAGVSVATVSKVLNGRSDVAPATRVIVQDLLKQHAYVRSSPPRPDSAAPPTVEVAVDGALAAYSAEVLQGVVDAGATIGVAVVLTSQVWAVGSQWVDRPSVWARSLSASGRRGLISISSNLGAAQVAALNRARVPLVVVDPMNLPISSVVSVGSTNFAGGMTATQHLLDLGHRRIAYIGGPETAACNQARLHGYLAAMESADAPVPPGFTTTGLFEYESGAARAGQILDLPEPPTAIFAGSDEVALGVAEAARMRHLRVPQDISVIGFDGTQLARMAAPPLTTVRQPLREMGSLALRTLLRLASGETIESHHVELATTLIIRGSTAPMGSE